MSRGLRARFVLFACATPFAALRRHRVSVNAARAGEPKPLSELLPHGAFWRELGGLVVDGAAWTLRGGGSKSDATAPLASSTGAIVE